MSAEIPEDLQERYARCCHPDDECYSAWECTLIERIAALQAENARLSAWELAYEQKIATLEVELNGAEAQVAAYNTNGFADADAMASAYLDMRLRAETAERIAALTAQNRQLREALTKPIQTSEAKEKA